MAVHASDEDMNAIQNLFNNEHKWILGKMQAHYREINSMFADELRVAQKRYKEYDGCYLGHYIQYFFWFSSLWASSFLSQLLFRGLVATMDGLNKLLLRTWFGATNWNNKPTDL